MYYQHFTVIRVMWHNTSNHASKWNVIRTFRACIKESNMFFFYLGLIIHRIMIIANAAHHLTWCICISIDVTLQMLHLWQYMEFPRLKTSNEQRTSKIGRCDLYMILPPGVKFKHKIQSFKNVSDWIPMIYRLREINSRDSSYTSIKMHG